MRAVILLFALYIAVPASAQNTVSPVKTVSGCTILYPPSDTKDFKIEYDWSGYCVNGLAEGLGTLTIRTAKTDGTPIFSMKLTTRFREGTPFGLGFFTGVNSIGSLTFGSGVFDQIYFSLGVKADESLVANDALPLPTFDFSLAQPGQSMIYGDRMIMYAKHTCAVYAERPQFSECGYEDGQKQYDVYVVVVYQRSPLKLLETIFCPEPRSQNSCTETISRVATPYTRQIHTLIEESRPEYQRRLAAMNAAVATQKLADQTRKQAAAAAQVEAERARIDKLAQAGPGELFALADEARSANDKEGARAALRALVKRFPDHPLAKLAASEMIKTGE